MGSVTGALETLNLSERLGSYIHSLSHITNREGKTVEKREREREREKGRGRKGGREQREAFPIAVKQLTVPCLKLSDLSNVFQALKLVLGETTMIKLS